MHPFGNKSKFKTHVNTPCDKEGGWVNSVCRELEFRWMYCPPMHSQHWVEVKRVEFLWHLGPLIVSKGGGEVAYKRVWEKIRPLIEHFNAQPLPVRARTILKNIVLVPKILYMVECVPPQRDIL